MGIDYEYEHRNAEHEHGEAPEKRCGQALDRPFLICVASLVRAG